MVHVHSFFTAEERNRSLKDKNSLPLVLAKIDDQFSLKHTKVNDLQCSLSVSTEIGASSKVSTTE